MIFPTVLPLGEVLQLLLKAWSQKDFDLIPFKYNVIKQDDYLALSFNDGYVVHVYDDEIYVCEPNETMYCFHSSVSHDNESLSFKNDGFYKCNGEITYRSYEIFDKTISKNRENDGSKTSTIKQGNNYYKVHFYHGLTERAYNCVNGHGSIYASEVYDGDDLKLSSLTVRDTHSDFHTIECRMDDGMAKYNIRKGLDTNIEISMPFSSPAVEFLWNKYDTFQLEIDDGFEDICFVRDQIWSSLQMISSTEGKSSVLRDIMNAIRSQIEATDENGI